MADAKPSRPWVTRAGAGLAVLAVALPLLPVVGLVLGALDPPKTLFPGQGQATWGGLIRAPDGSLGPFSQSLLLAFCVAILALPAGAFLAWAERRWRYAGSSFLGWATILPLAIPSYVLASTIRHAMGPGGAIGGPLGLKTFAGFWPAVCVLTLTTLPYVQLLVGSALARCPADEEEAARSLGATRWTAFRTAVLPRIRPALAFSLLLVQLYVISDFGAVAVLDCRVLTWRLYQAVTTTRLDLALKLASGVMALTIPLLLAARWIHGRTPATGAANPRLAERVTPSKPQLAGLFLLQVLVLGLGVAVPLLTLVAWIWDGVQRGLSFASPWLPLAQSLGIALVGALVTTALALAPAWFAVRAKRRAGWAIEQGTYMSSALPGVFLAFGLLLLALHGSRLTGYDPKLYHWLLGSGLLLVAGYATRFLSEAFASLKPGVELLDPRQDESARALGATLWQRARRVIGPALAPAGSVAFVLTTTAIVKELPVTLLLGGPLGVRPLSFRMYDRYTEALLHDAGLAGLMIVAVGGITIAFLRGRQS